MGDRHSHRQDRSYDSSRRGSDPRASGHHGDRTHRRYRRRSYQREADVSDEELRRENHHLAQNTRSIARFDISELRRELVGTDPRRRYYRRVNELRTTNHWGQRKLLLSEIEFLTLFGHEANTVLYIGAAPGPHIEYLSSLFPALNFVLVDPADFTCRETDRIRIRQEFFTDELAREYSDRPTLMISDIRTADPGALEEEEVEVAIVSDQEMQMKWHLILNPRHSMLKFRLPWGAGQTVYLGGTVFLPVWGRQTTTETRLVCSGREVRTYDNTEYEEQMFHFNTVTRVSYFAHQVEGVPGLCHCYDCAAEVAILTRYLQQKDSFSNGTIDPSNGWTSNLSLRVSEEMAERVAEMSIRLNTACSPHGGRSLRDIVGHGQQWFTPRTYHPEEGRIVHIDEAAAEAQRRTANRGRQRDTRDPRSADLSHLVNQVVPTASRSSDPPAGRSEKRKRDDLEPNAGDDVDVEGSKLYRFIWDPFI